MLAENMRPGDCGSRAISLKRVSSPPSTSSEWRPRDTDGTYDMSQVRAAVSSLVPHLRGDSLVIGKSTVSPGTAAGLQSVSRHVPAGPGPSRGRVEPGVPAGGLRGADTLRPDPSWRARAAARPQRSSVTSTGRTAISASDDRHRPDHGGAGQGGGECVSRHKDLVHQRDGGHLRGDRRRCLGPCSFARPGSADR